MTDLPSFAPLPNFAPLAASVTFVGAGPGSALHLTLGAYRALQGADVVVHDRLVGAEVLALIPPHVRRVDVGKEGFGSATAQSDIHAVLVAEGLAGHRVVRLKGGDVGIFGRLDEEIAALEAAGLSFAILPGLTAASVAAAAIGQSLTQRGRNKSLRILTGHDIEGFAEQDWRGLAQQGEVAAIYMGKKSARFVQGRLMMHGAAADTAITVVENVSRPDQRIFAGTLVRMADTVALATGPAVILLGLAPRAAGKTLKTLKESRA